MRDTERYLNDTFGELGFSVRGGRKFQQRSSPAQKAGACYVYREIGGQRVLVDVLPPGRRKVRR